MVVLDFSKAFDHVPNQRLLRKLHHYGIRSSTYHWISSFLSGRTQKVIVEGCSSDCSSRNYIKSLWKDSTGIAPLKDNGRLFNASKDKADILNRQYQSVFTQEDPDTQVPDPDGKPYPDMNNIYVSEDGVRKLLQKSNPRKATGPDMIPARLLKECAEELAPILAIIYNKSIQTGKVPDDWKKANVSAVFKKGQRYDPANYRPVSLTCLCCKILEHIIVSSVMKHVDTQSILTDCQHGFRARRSCESQLVTLTHDLASSLDNGKQTDMVVLDFSKAFDRVPH